MTTDKLENNYDTWHHKMFVDGDPIDPLTLPWYANTVCDFHPHRAVAIAPYGVDLVGWAPAPVRSTPRDVITFLFARQSSLRKGIPLLLEAWERPI